MPIARGETREIYETQARPGGESSLRRLQEAPWESPSPYASLDCPPPEITCTQCRQETTEDAKEVILLKSQVIFTPCTLV